jgi:hypothetical protein
MLLVVFELAEQDAVTDALVGDATRGDTFGSPIQPLRARLQVVYIVKVGLTVRDRSTRLT